MTNAVRQQWWLRISLGVYFILLSLYGVWSYGLTDPNLRLSRSELYWQFQQWAWQTLYHNPHLQTQLFVALVLALFVCFGVIVWQLAQSAVALTRKNIVKYTLVFIVLTAPLLISYNALSHDVFNYMFNAKMVVVYQANPHQQVALDFAYDDWTRFMHNTHTTAPYWYGWTALSLVPYMLGFGKFILIWLNFRLFSLAGILLFGALLYRWQQKRSKSAQLWQFALFFLNPLVLIELLNNSHNDIWMILPAFAAFYVVLTSRKRAAGLLSFALLLLSISTKYATAILLPLWLLAGKMHTVFMRRIVVWMMPKMVQGPARLLLRFLKRTVRASVFSFVPLSFSVTLFLPLLISRSRWFLPWYLVWSASMIPLLLPSLRQPEELKRLDVQLLDRLLAKLYAFRKLWVIWLLSLSVSSLLRYVPWIWFGGYAQPLATKEVLITWVGGGVVFALTLVVNSFKHRPRKLIQ